MQAVS